MNARRIIFAGVEITPETIAATREHFAAIHQACIAEVESGARRVNDAASFVAFHTAAITASLAGEHDGSLTFAQRAHYLQTGESVALLP